MSPIANRMTKPSPCAFSSRSSPAFVAAIAAGSLFGLAGIGAVAIIATAVMLLSCASRSTARLTGG